MTPETNLICERLALEETAKSFNDIVARHGLDATDAVLVVMNLAAMTIANQYVRGENKKEYRRKFGETMDHLIRFYLPRIES